MLMLQLYSYSGQTQRSFRISSLQQPQGKGLNEGMAFVQEQRALSAGYGAQGALWEHGTPAFGLWPFFGVPGMHFPPHSLFWLLVTFQQQHE